MAACAGGALLDIKCPKAEVKRGPGTLHPPACLPACLSACCLPEQKRSPREGIHYALPLAACLLVQGVVQERGTSPAVAEEDMMTDSRSTISI